MIFDNSEKCAIDLDQSDPLRQFRRQFYFPTHEGKDVLYLSGNSLGLQPIGVEEALTTELRDWKKLGVEGHFKGQNPWFRYHRFLKPSLAKLTGAKESEVTPMGSLTSNLHLMLVSFYQPTSSRFKIIVEAGAFPSDMYAIASQCELHGYDPDEAIIEIAPKPGTHTITTSEIVQCIDEHKDQLALVMLSGVQYYTGQLFDIRSITLAGKNAGAKVGWDLAHAIGNVTLQLHDDQVDFAVWCSYKYLNSGPGGTGGIFVHENHGDNPALKRFAGWWGHAEDERFLMKKGFKAMKGADGWQLSNANVLSMAAQKASLEIFDEAGINDIRKKSMTLTGYLRFLLQQIAEETGVFKIITPHNPDEHGAQLSLLFSENGMQVFEGLLAAGISVDWREPDTIRVAPAPLYNSYHDVFTFSQVMAKLLK